MFKCQEQNNNNKNPYHIFNPKLNVPRYKICINSTNFKVMGKHQNKGYFKQHFINFSIYVIVFHFMCY